MLIGTIKTLSDVERYVDAAMLKVDQDRNKMKRQLQEKQFEVNSVPRAIMSDDNIQVANPDYVKSWEEFQTMQREFKEMHEKADWLKGKKKELETFEEAARQKGLLTTKDEYKIELTLNDLQYLDIPEEELHPKGPEEE